ncbi:MAG: cytochrome b [Candidatus Kryptoniota bacterium]
MTGFNHKLLKFLGERIDLDLLKRYIRNKTVPQHKYSFWYYFGGIALFLLLLQIVTGILLSFYYVPTPEKANESVKFIVTYVSFGWLIRSLHFWGSNLLIAILLVHMFSTYFLKAYRKPRELMWVIGVLLIFLMLGFAFTGYLLPWTSLSYFATKIGVSTPYFVPLIGKYLSVFLQGGEEVGAATLTRMYSLHTIVLPMLVIALVTIHIILSQVLGSSVPISQQKNVIGGTKFYPDFAFRDFAVWAGVLAILLLLSGIAPETVGQKANPIEPAPAGIKPEWYFLFVFQTLRMMPEVLAVGLIALFLIFWIVVPFLDRKSSREETGKLFTIVGIVVLLYFFTTTLVAFMVK